MGYDYDLSCSDHAHVTASVNIGTRRHEAVDCSQAAGGRRHPRVAWDWPPTKRFTPESLAELPEEVGAFVQPNLLPPLTGREPCSSDIA